MTEEQEQHLTELTDTFRQLFTEKYRKGQAEHKDNLWDRVPLVNDSIEEALDSFAYAVTLKNQLNQVKFHIETARNQLQSDPGDCEKHLGKALAFLK